MAEAAAVRAVVAATGVCRLVQQRLESVRAITKDDRSPVTVADFASQAVVAHLLREVLGEVCLVAEETSVFLRDPAHGAHLEATLEAARVGWPGVTAAALLDAIDLGGSEPRSSGFWTLDPIDGTKGFLRGQQYAVCLGYIVGSEPVIGVLGCPNLAKSFDADLASADPAGCVYVASKGAGAWEVGDPSNRLRCTPWEPGMPVSLCESVDSGHSDHAATAAIISKIGTTGAPARLDSQCKYAVVARGQADVYLRLPTTRGYVERIWDHAAGTVIAQEAGCVVSDMSGRALDFSCGKGLEKNRGVCVASARLHGAIVSRSEFRGESSE